jgi:CRISPR system Cascade subunit CasB
VTESIAARPSKTLSDEFLATIWWWRMQKAKPDGTSNPEANPGALARLRRCSSPVEALAEPMTIELCRRLNIQAHQHTRVEAVAVLAIVLAQVRTDAGQRVKLGTLLGPQGGDDGNAPLHELRLRRLLAARDGAELLRGFREAVALLGGTVPVIDTASLILGWLDPHRGDRTRTRFLFDYHGASDAAPPEADDSSDAA